MRPSRRLRLLYAVGPVLALLLLVVGLAWRGRRREAAPRPAPSSLLSVPRPHAQDSSRDLPAASEPLRVLPDDDPSGALRLEGMVQDAQERPVANAVVAISSHPPRTTTTQEDGSFFVEGLVARTYTITARGDAGVSSPVTTQLTERSEPVILVLRPGSTLSVTVTDGRAPLDARVELRGLEVRQQTTVGGASQFTHVAAGEYEVAASAPGFATRVTRVGVWESETTATMILERGVAVTGRVVDEAGHPIASALVVAEPASAWDGTGDRGRDGVATTADGTFTLPSIRAGSMRFVATHGDYARASSAIVTLDGVRSVDGVQITMVRGQILEGHVVDHQRTAVPGAQVRVLASQRGFGGFGGAIREVYTDERGAFVLRGLPVGPLSVVALHERGSSSVVDVATERRDLELVIDATSFIAGIVVDPDGEPVAGVQVAIAPSLDGPIAPTQWRLRGFAPALSDGGGAFRFNALAAGTYTVTAASPRALARRRGPWGIGASGLTVRSGQQNVRLVYKPEGGLKGRVAFANGEAPPMFTISAGGVQESFGDIDQFHLVALAEGSYDVTVRGTGFEARTVSARVVSGETTDLGTITVAKGRTLAGTVVADGTPVPGATVYIGRMITGNGSSFGDTGRMMGQAARQVVTDDAGRFTLAGFGATELTVIADHPDVGRSAAMRVAPTAPDQGALELTLQKYGSLAGALVRGGAPISDVLVTCQSTTAPGGLSTVASGDDGRYRFDRLAPDTYKVSATVGMPMTGMKFYSKEVVVLPGATVNADLTVDPGTVEVSVALTADNGKVGAASVYLLQGTHAAATQAELSAHMASASNGSSQWLIIRNGEPARFTEVKLDTYSACAVVFPAEIRGMAMMSYLEKHGDELPVFCATRPVTAALQLPLAVHLPAYIPDAPDPGSGSGSGAAP